MRYLRRANSLRRGDHDLFRSVKVWALPFLALVLLGWFVGLKWFSSNPGSTTGAVGGDERGAIAFKNPDSPSTSGDRGTGETQDAAQDYTFYRTLEEKEKGSGGVEGLQQTAPATSSSKKDADRTIQQVAKVEPKQEPAREIKKSVIPPAAEKDKPASGYTLQVASFSNEQSARQMISRLKSRGYSPTIEKASLPDGKSVYRVRIGQYSTREEADQAAERYHAEGKGKAIVQRG